MDLVNLVDGFLRRKIDSILTLVTAIVEKDHHEDFPKVLTVV